jgi:DNA-binding GntR family transcriptional regulator
LAKEKASTAKKAARSLGSSANGRGGNPAPQSDELSWARVLELANLSRDGSRSRADFVYEAIRSAIQVGFLVRGKRVREEDVAEGLGVSRTPVREALWRLQSSGLLELAYGKGLSVSVISRRQVLELFDMREVLEGAAARFAAQHASESEVLRLRNLVAESLTLENDPLKTTALNRVFHHAIYDAAHNSYLLGSLENVYDSMALLGKTTYSMKGRARSAYEEHLLIVEAIMRRDPDGADRAARAHIAMARQARLEIIDAQ